MNDFIYAGRHLSDWIGLLESDYPHVRLSAARALGEIGSEAKAAVPGLIRLLEERDEFIRSAAASSLGNIGPEAASAIPAMVKALKASDYFHQGIITPAIAGVGPASIPALIDLLKTTPGLRWEVINVLSQKGPEAKAAVPCLTELLSDKEAKVREEAAFALCKLTGRRDTIEIIIQCLNDPDDFARINAVDHLGHIGADVAVVAIPALVRALNDESDAVRNRAAEALGRISSGAENSVPDLLRASGTVRLGMFRDSVVKAITGIGQDATPMLLNGLKDRDGYVRRTAAEALGVLGPGKTLAAIPGLTEMTDEMDAENRLTAAMALWRIHRDERSVPIIVQALRNDNFIVRSFALQCLYKIGPDAKFAVPALIDMLKDGNQFLRSDAAKTLGKIGPDAAGAAVPALKSALRDQDLRTRVASALALWQIARDQTVVSTLMKELQHSEDRMRWTILTALGEIGPEAQSAVPRLIEVLRNDPDNQYKVVVTLAKIGPAAKAALPALIEAFNDEAALHRKEIAAAIKAIEPVLAPDTR